MRALRVYTAGAGRGPELADVPEPSADGDDLLVETLVLGVCGTDREIVEQGLPAAPSGRDWAVLGHESLGRVLRAPTDSGFETGDLVVGMVRRPDPVPCRFCAAQRPDLCENGRFTERGIKGLDGFGAERFTLDPRYAVRVAAGLERTAVLVEPTSVAVKAWEQADRAAGRPAERVLVLGAGPIGLLCALLGVQRGLEVHVVDRIEAGPKPEQTKALGAAYHTHVRDLAGAFDRVLECTGILIEEAIALTAPAGAACLVGGGDPRSSAALNAGALSHDLLAWNKALVGTVNAGRSHFEAAHGHLCAADRPWLESLLTDSVPIEAWPTALHPSPEAIKSVVHFHD
ncbi:alcohol dehydrogenase catalytic domain-containing protein [Actinomadura gamaensis]|uniref:Alcohol dehydrogenase catalytic domain-containing protein n=1 Tax=Actinomadura gamaensis TaxID=1763541 RepID=A0ABV9TVH3_9ACTN